MKLRLLLFPDCNRKCKGCCNKDWDLENLPICRDFTPYDLIMLTGGEPMLAPDIIKHTIRRIRKQNNCPVVLYTAKCDTIPALFDVLTLVDGLTLTLHTKRDVEPFGLFNKRLTDDNTQNKSLRLNVFHNVSLDNFDLSRWIVKSGIKWIKDCPLPTDEVFMRI
jgi:organic radical activating enzyme